MARVKLMADYKGNSTRLDLEQGSRMWWNRSELLFIYFFFLILIGNAHKLYYGSKNKSSTSIPKEIEGFNLGLHMFGTLLSLIRLFAEPEMIFRSCSTEKKT